MFSTETVSLGFSVDFSNRLRRYAAIAGLAFAAKLNTPVLPRQNRPIKTQEPTPETPNYEVSGCSHLLGRGLPGRGWARSPAWTS